MTSAQTAPRTYQLHRERQRRRILDSAEKLFDERGINRVTMAEITSASGVRGSTMYQYFSNKDDIVWAIFETILADAVTRVTIATQSATTAFEKITALLETMAADLADDPAQIRFLAQFDAMYAREWPAERLLDIYAQRIPDRLASLGGLIRDGIADGSLRADLDPEISMQAVLNTVIGAQRRLASLGNRIEVEYGQPVHKLFRETIRIILSGLRAN